MMNEKYIGLVLAVLSAMFIGTSFVVTKMGLIQASQQHGFHGDGFSYLRSPLWWCGMLSSVFGEVLNAAAYAFAPAILVTPLGALSVLLGAILGATILKERLGMLGKCGCALCLIGSVLLVLHAPPDKDIQTIDEVLDLTLQPLFMLYLVTVAIFAVYMIFIAAPTHGRTNPLIYISICASVGSVAVMAVKAVGLAVRLTFSGSNQFIYPSTYIFTVVLVVCLLTQTAYVNKAMNHFPTSLVNALYYVAFTTCTLSASFILFGGLNSADYVDTISLLGGFMAMLAGVYLLTMFRPDTHGKASSDDQSGSYSSIDDLIRGPHRQILAPWRRHRHSESSIGSRGDRDGLLGGNEEMGTEVELAGLDNRGKLVDRIGAGASNETVALYDRVLE